MKLSLSLRPTVNTDVWFLTENMRLADQIECGLACPGTSLYEILARSVETTDAPWTAVDADGEVVAIFGCAFENKQAYPWMLSTPYISKHARACIELGRICMEAWTVLARAREVPILCNYIHKTNHSARRFITRLGFTILPAPNGDFDCFFLCVNQ